MKTTNFADRNISASLRVLYCLALACCFTFAGCRNQFLHTFSRLEEEALKYGTVSAGAARVTEYDCNDLSRKRLRDALCRMRCKWLKNPDDKPKGYWTDYASTYLSLMLGFKMSQEKSKQADSGSAPPPALQDPSTYFEGLSNLFKTMMDSQPPRAREIELIGFYMAAQKFVESELEELNLGTTADPKFRRVVVSLDLTAWVRGKARALLVYIDLYPHEADSWCQEGAKVLKTFSKKDNLIEMSEYEAEWRETLKKLRGFSYQCIKDLCPPTIPKGGLVDCVALCHRWLEKNKLRPRIIQVERMSQGEYLILGEGSYSGTEFQVGGAHPAGVSGSLKAGTARKTEGLMAKVRPLSLAFVAGERRAGWLFMPGKITEGRMPPTERRLRMVVDIPKDLVKLGIHVHKLFLDADLRILPGATFAKQVDNLDRTRQILTEGDKSYKKYKEEPRHYRLIKTRMRNLLHQGWSEETVVDIPPK
ncbi:MAG: hypothetical protein ACYTBX_15125 [Planctomycetota bacterium]|jgi:hypothetical protein